MKKNKHAIIPATTLPRNSLAIFTINEPSFIGSSFLFLWPSNFISRQNNILRPRDFPTTFCALYTRNIKRLPLLAPLFIVTVSPPPLAFEEFFIFFRKTVIPRSKLRPPVQFLSKIRTYPETLAYRFFSALYAHIALAYRTERTV